MDDRVKRISDAITRAADDAEHSGKRDGEEPITLAEYGRRLCGAGREETARALALAVADAMRRGGASADGVRRQLDGLAFSDVCEVADRAGVTVGELAAWYAA